MPEEMDDNGQKKKKTKPPQRVAGSYPSFRRSAGLVWVNFATMVLLDRPPCRMIAESGSLARIRPTQSTWLETALFTAPAGNSPLS